MRMTAARVALLGGAFGGGSGGVVGGGIAEFFAGPGTHGMLWLAAFIGAIVGGVFSALVTRRSAYKPTTTGTNSDANEPPN